MEIETTGWQANSFVGDTQAYPRDEHCQSSVGSAADPWRTPQARHRYRTDQRGQVHGQAKRPAIPRLISRRRCSTSVNAWWFLAAKRTDLPAITAEMIKERMTWLLPE